ncbi:Ig domain-containing protein [Pedococcus bigeumensis]|uniref:Uncharacterized protein n=1 Tax=Pedococcus bigeumensis TaxID=433644 RepID=A0A502CW26_9MICO|nr:Ig domain-containing protein [Pedococcus bigeumensis]TPG16862.1 hypothetical protein EAH86_08685 [Pedococcus bigeumensis]
MFLPPHWGTYYFTLHYECVDGTSMDVAYSLYAAPAPLVAEWPYPDRGVVGNDYRLQLTAQGGVAPYSWSLTAGTLPPGFTLSSSGLLVAEPAQSSGEFSFTVLVTDAWGTTTSQNLRLDVQDYLITSLGYGPGTVGQPYSARGELDPAGAPYTLEVRSGTIPPGLTLNSQTGRLEGSPTTVGSYAPFIRVHDAQGRLAYLNYVVEILAFHGVPQFQVDSMPDGLVGSEYQAMVAITGGNGGYNLSFPDGEFPPGLAVRTLPCAPNSSVDCKFFVGVPTTAGTYPFVIRAEDQGGLSTSRRFVITVTA